MSTETSQETTTDQCALLGITYSLGWASSEEGLLGRLPEIIGRWLHASRTSLVIQDRKGATIHEAAHESPGNTLPSETEDWPVFQVDRPLLSKLRWQLRVHASSEQGFSAEDERQLDCVVKLLQSTLECILVKERDNHALGAPFDQLSEREWETCRRLEGFESEKQIAEALGYSRHTLHTYVKCAYRKTNTRSRLEFVHILGQARRRLRQEVVEKLLAENE